jgi:hypothetical protein
VLPAPDSSFVAMRAIVHLGGGADFR